SYLGSDSDSLKDTALNLKRTIEEWTGVHGTVCGVGHSRKANTDAVSQASVLQAHPEWSNSRVGEERAAERESK
ncbi:unnamed protein product, partial [Durusdinium trenchii]